LVRSIIFRPTGASTLAPLPALRAPAHHHGEKQMDVKKPPELERIRASQDAAYEVALEQLAEDHKIRDKLEQQARRFRGAAAGSGDMLLDDVHAFVGRFVAYPSLEARVAHTLWIAHAHLMGCWESTPRIAFLSPEPGSGKTRALEITETLVPRPVEAINATPAYLFRKVSDDEGLPTILYDEIDTLFGPKAKDNEEIRGVLNAGHRRGATAGRCVVRGTVIETEELPAFCAIALAGLGNLPDTILSRSVVIRMRRRAPTEYVEPYRRRVHGPEGNAIRDRLAAWAAAVESSLDPVPVMPPGVEDRNADVWEALLSVAEAARGDWPTRARSAASFFVRAVHNDDSPSLGIRLLADLRMVFADRTAVSTDVILKTLNELDEAPWGDYRGRPLDNRRLANLLKPYGVRSRNLAEGGRRPKGYARDDLHDAWVRYTPQTPATCATSAAAATTVAEVAQVADSSDNGGAPPKRPDEACQTCHGIAFWWSAMRGGPWRCCGCEPADARFAPLEFCEVAR
jgi:Protein of unknown function (DUF3631)